MADVDEPTPLYRLLDTLLPDGVDAYVAARRGEGMSWRRIEQAIREQVSVDVTYQTLRAWYPELIEAG